MCYRCDASLTCGWALSAVPCSNRKSEWNEAVLIEELEGRQGATIRRMRFSSNMELEQSEVLSSPTTSPLPAPHPTVPKGQPQPATLLTRCQITPFRQVRLIPRPGAPPPPPGEEPELVADNSYIPYECLQGMLISLVMRDAPFPLTGHGDKREVCVVGLAGGMLPRFMGDYFNVHVTAVELDPVVCEMAGKYLGLQDSLNITVVAAEGMEYLRGCEDGLFDLSIVDVNAQSPENPLEAPPEEFVSPESLAHLARVTSKGGIAIINLLCSDAQLFEVIISRVKDAFHGTVCTLRGTDEGNAGHQQPQPQALGMSSDKP